MLLRGGSMGGQSLRPVAGRRELPDNRRLGRRWCSEAALRRCRDMAGSLDRRGFLKSAAVTGAAIGLGTSQSTALLAAEEGTSPLFKISLAEWSFHRMLRANKLDNLDF